MRGIATRSRSAFPLAHLIKMRYTLPITFRKEVFGMVIQSNSKAVRLSRHLNPMI